VSRGNRRITKQATGGGIAHRPMLSGSWQWLQLASLQPAKLRL